MEHIDLTLEPLPPFRLDLTVWILRRRPDNIVDRWDGQTYRRIMLIKGVPCEVAVSQKGSPREPTLKIAVTGAGLDAGTSPLIAGILTRSLGLQIDLTAFYEALREDRRLWPLVQPFRGCKPTRFPSLYEALINGIACQQFTLTAGIRQLNKLAANFGASLALPTGTFSAFPRPEDLDRPDPDALRKLGFSRQKARAIGELSAKVASGFLDLENWETLEDEAAREKLLALRGVGRWTAEYVMLRGLGRVHIFPADDVGGRNNLARFLGRTGALDYAGVNRLLGKSRPYGGLIYFHLLLNHLAEEEYIKAGPAA